MCSLVLLPAVAFAGPTPDAAPERASAPLGPTIMFTLPWYGELGELIARGRIALGLYPGIQLARDALQSLPRSGMALAVSCADVSARMAVQKALKSLDDNALPQATLLLMDGQRCKPGLRAEAERVGLRTSFSEAPHLYPLLRRGGRRAASSSAAPRQAPDVQ